MPLILLVWLVAGVDTLTLDAALQAAREHNPQLQQAHAQTEQTRQLTLYGWSQMLPQLNGNLQYSRSTSNFANSPGALPPSYSGPSAETYGASYNYYSLGLTLSQLVYDFGQAYYNMRSFKAAADSWQQSEASTLSQVMLGVRKAFFNARTRRALLEVARGTLANQSDHRAQVQAYVDVGKRPVIDLLQATADYSQSRVAVINAAGDYQVAKAQLNQAIGVEREVDYEVADDGMDESSVEAQPLGDLLATARTQRPDLLATRAMLDSNTADLRSTEAGFFPTVSVSANLSDAGEALDGLVWNWKVMATLSWSIFGSGETYYAMQEDLAQVAAATSTVSVVEQQVRLDVQAARVAVGAAKEAQVAAATALENATQLLRLAEARYGVGLGTMIELGDAQIKVSTAASQHAQAQLQVANARAQLLYSLGRW